jgi:putative hydrolase of the HAD superfamily
MIKGVLFDFDSTLYNYEEINKKALKKLFNHISNENKINNELIETEFNKITLNIKKSNNYHNKFNKSIYIKYLIKNLSLPLYKYIDYKKIYDDEFMNSIQLYPGVIELLELFYNKKIKIGMITNNIFEQQIEKLNKLSISKYFDYIITSSECGYEKPNEMIFIYAINKMNIDIDNICMIGDDYINDIEPLKNVGITGFLFKNDNSDILYNDYFRFGSFLSLIKFFKEYFKTIEEYEFLSKLFGQSTLNVQGQGGNISIKLNELLFIKSSGSILGNTSIDDGYTITHNIETFPIVFGSKKNKKPSMEIFFHSYMKKYVIHLHFVLANIFLCTDDNIDNKYKIIEYEIPGKKLAENIYTQYDTNNDIYLLKNHGIIITGNTIDDVIGLYIDLYLLYNSQLNNIYTNELLCFRINIELYKKFNKSIVCRIYDKYNFDKIIYIYPDLAVYIQSIEKINKLDLIKTFNNIPDIIIYNNIIFVIADNLIKLYSIFEILDSYNLIKNNSLELISINNKTIQEMEEEKFRKSN